MTDASRWLESFSSALARGDSAAAANLFEPDGYWRDLVAFTWTLHTSEGRATIRSTLERTLANASPTTWTLTGPSPVGDGFLFSFTTRTGRGVGHLRVRGDDDVSGGRAWTLLTALRELKGFEEPAGPRRVHYEQKNPAPAEPYVLIVGGGQGGIALAARLKRLAVPAVVVEKNARAGDSWRKRYASLCLHDPVWYDHLPYIPFPDHWPVFSPKDRIADWLEMYTRVMDLDYWTSTECLRARPIDGGWEVDVLRDGVESTLKPRHLVLATGMSGFPFCPPVKGGRERFTASGGLVFHSSSFGSGSSYRGKKCIVVGSSTSAHDICADLVESGAAEVTMIQRAPTIVVRSETLMELAWGRLFSEKALAAGITTDIADLTLASVPFKELPGLQRPLYQEIARRDADLYAGLTRAGFLHDMGEDGSGLHSIYLRRGAGYYIDVGASQMIIDGRIKLRTKVNVVEMGERSVTLSDGTVLPADLVVFATGYGNMGEWAAKLISPEVAERVGPVWGVGSATRNDPGPWEGELRNMWKPTAQPGLWFHGGNLMQSRHYSLYLALQLKARYEGLRE
ncbi:MAG TPA: NAD(P)/FAD-dependent oxidoreductase [Burkholderiales bacterium]|nr:NAD(P)/FAD-dependent oxidoreductase [Burkholderiales bacterium]